MLICPILHDYYENPITLPCCGKTISRDPLISYFDSNGINVCPCCRSNLDYFDPVNAALSRDMMHLVEQAQKADTSNASSSNVSGSSGSSNSSASGSSDASSSSQKADGKREAKEAKWSGKIIKLQNEFGPFQKVIGKLEIKNTNNAFNFKILIIPVIDESGSMSGNPINQARYACQEVLNVVYRNSSLETSIVSYESTANTINVDKKQPIDQARAAVNRIGRGGGTVFRSAFDHILKIAEQSQKNPEISKIVIIFLTDGEDNTAANARGSLAASFGNEIKAVWKRDFTVHTVGFGGSHDFSFLNALRMIGTEEGAYRYANPQEDTDSLSKKIYSILQVIASSGSIPIRLISNDGNIPILHSDNGKYWIDLTPNESFPGGYDNLATYKFRISTSTSSSSSGGNSSNSSNASSDANPQAPNAENEFEVEVGFEELHDYKETWEQWYSYLTDQISTELLMISGSTSSSSKSSASSSGAQSQQPQTLTLDKELHCQLLIHRARAISIRTDPESPTTHRLKKLIEMTEAVLRGAKVDQMSLNDMKFEGKFATAVN